MRNNPLVWIDPSGHNPECGPDGAYCDSAGKPINLRLPSSKSLIDSKTENSGTTDQNLEWYQEIREQLLIDSGTQYVDRSGKIKDFVLVALILAMEVGAVRDYAESFYAAALSAVSQQYFSSRLYQDPSSSTVCYGGCSTKEQLIWLQGMHAVRTSLGSVDNLFKNTVSSGIYWKGFINDALRATESPLQSSDGHRYWAWGDYPSRKGNITLSSIDWPLNQTGYFEVFGYTYGWKK